jgi:uncharacterized protein (TIGR02646 family)
MRAVKRSLLAELEQADLDRRQSAVLEKYAAGILSVESEWKAARQSRSLKSVLTNLQSMMGDTQRCMYCLDSHGTDIEHFWPKKPYPERMFRWPNLLLCCAECGRLKGDRFPLHDGQALLIDPTATDPWQDLDFDPTTGNIFPRFDISTSAESRKGTATVELLRLDRREALAAGYRRTFKRLSQTVSNALGSPSLEAEQLFERLCDDDSHGLLGWCLEGTGQRVAPFSELREQRPEVWRRLIERFRER